MIRTISCMCRHLPPNFYYNMQDYCEERRAQGAKWTWWVLLF